jgi:formate dehydrogenase iron-sulfur subunit
LELPLLNRAYEGDSAFVISDTNTIVLSDAASHCGVKTKATNRALPGPGEQYRFHFDMTKCIGCKCCVVACNEQNGNPADILFRRVGEIEGGTYPNTQRHYLSMGCNHCVEPTCLTGCPVNAYDKDVMTGIVRHSADMCIGCQYCTWNCSYGVPQYNPERGVVGKCDMCHGRLMEGQDPACVNACPEDAIQIEIVKIAEWRDQYQATANAPGMPSADHSISTTRITLPRRLAGDVGKVDLTNLRTEDPHWPLVIMTVLTQLSVGGFIAIWLSEALHARAHRSAAVFALLIALSALLSSTLHLGRPIHAIRALKMWRRSWLSREVLMFTLFTGFATAYSLELWMGAASASWLGGLTVLFGVCGVGASAKLYLVPGRPAWNSPFTILEFFGTTALLGAAVAEICDGAIAVGESALISSALIVLATSGLKMTWCLLSKHHELNSTGQLLLTVLSKHFVLRFTLLGLGMPFLIATDQSWAHVTGALLLIAGEFVGRYLFFVSVVPTNMATGFLAQEAA